MPSGTLNDCRKTLSQRNANPQMVVERALLALREAAHAMTRRILRDITDLLCERVIPTSGIPTPQWFVDTVGAISPAGGR